MRKQVIILSLDKDLIDRLKRVAAERQIPLTALIEQLTQDQLAQCEEYDLAKQRQYVVREYGFEFGTNGQAG